MLIRNKDVKYFLSGIFALIVCVSFNAAEAGESSIIFEGKKDTVIVGKEHLFVKQNTQQTFAKNESKTKSKALEPVKNDITEEESQEIVVLDFPLAPSSSSYSYINKESVVMVLPQRLHRCQAVCKVNRETTYPGTGNSNLFLYLPEQRQKFSTAAIQCGILTSFSPNSPSL